MFKYENEKLYKKYDNIRKHAKKIEKVPEFFVDILPSGLNIIKTLVLKKYNHHF